MSALDDALADFEERERFFRAEALAEPDPGLQSYRVLKWLAKRMAVELGAVEVKRYPASACPERLGFHWRGSRVVYVADSASRRTLIHEGLHLLREDLSEYVVRGLADHLDRELDELWNEPVASSPPATEVERNIEWVY